YRYPQQTRDSRHTHRTPAPPAFLFTAPRRATLSHPSQSSSYGFPSLDDWKQHRSDPSTVCIRGCAGRPAFFKASAVDKTHRRHRHLGKHLKPASSLTSKGRARRHSLALVQSTREHFTAAAGKVSDGTTTAWLVM